MNKPDSLAQARLYVGYAERRADNTGEQMPAEIAIAHALLAIHDRLAEIGAILEERLPCPK